MSEAWLVNYLEASWRGVPFFIKRSDRKVGRKTVLHTYPGRDSTFTEDLGKFNPTYAFDSYLLGDNYFKEREDLVKALEIKGVGKLIHPYVGEINAVLTSPVNLSETTSEGGIVRFNLTFKEQNIIKLTSRTISTTININEKTKSTYDALREAFAEIYDLAQEPVEAAQKALVAIDKGADIILDAKKIVSSVADFKAVIDNIKGKLIQIAFDTEDLANELQAAVTFGTDFTNTSFASNSKTQFYELQNLALKMSEQGGTGVVLIINTLIMQQAMVAANEMIATIDFTSTTDAEELRDQSFSLLNLILLDTNTANDVLSTVADNKASIEADFTKRISNLGQIFDYNILEESTTSLTISNAIYGDIEKEQDIIGRNKIQNPFFVTSPTPLKVVINV